MTKVDETLFEGEHYLGRPADHTDKIIGRRVNLVKQIPGFCNKDLSLLEIGCGNGATLLLMSNCMKECTGVDIYEGHKRVFEEAKAAQGVANCNMFIKNVEVEDIDGVFDRLICFEVIEHLNDDSHVSRFKKFLTPGALCAISVPNKWWVFETHGAKLPLLPWNRVPFFSWLPRPLHERWANARIYTKPRIKNLLENSGFEVLEMKYVTAPMDVLKEGALKRFLVKYVFGSDATSVPFLSTAIFIVARVK
ncbi:MAG TPA: class I SAM-dependent methyltransferase [Chitinophagales bacterium]|nr:class I SAM-dependent methyltransferase [Chitinophagales bacterium]